MSEKQLGSSTVQEMLELKAKFEKIKAETEEFIESAKHLSDTGMHEAKELVDAAKSNWQSIVSTFSSFNLGGIFGRSKAKTPKKAAAMAKKRVKGAAKKVKVKAKAVVKKRR